MEFIHYTIEETRRVEYVDFNQENCANKEKYKTSCSEKFLNAILSNDFKKLTDAIYLYVNDEVIV
ncbi:MAG: hypothetical protein OEY79_01550 [Anaplasmataceae bacterium]|nr:hypothetical protein [Anaplasmataceae bacterium]